MALPAANRNRPIEGVSRLTTKLLPDMDDKGTAIFGGGGFPSWWWPLSETFHRMRDWEEGEADLDNLLSDYDARGINAGWIEGAHYYASRIRDGLFCFTLEARCWWQEARRDDVALTRGDLPYEDLGGFPDFGLDPLHTRLGIRAVELWLRSYLTPPRYTVKQVAAALWNAESAACAMSRFWSQGTALQQAAYVADLARHGLGRSEQPGLWAWLRQEQATLRSVRRVLWHSYVQSQNRQEIEQSPLPSLPRSLSMMDSL